MTRTRKRAVAPPEEVPSGDLPPRYDPTVHRDPTQEVFLELVCACGSIRRQRDPVHLVAPVLVDWWAQHGGDGHSPASNADAVAEREERRRAAHRAAGDSGYRPGEYPHLDDSNEQARPWPQPAETAGDTGDDQEEG